MLEELFILIFGNDIIKGLGVNTRYLFFKAFNKTVKKEDLIGILKKHDADTMYKHFNQNVYNLVIGYFILVLFIFIIGAFFL